MNKKGILKSCLEYDAILGNKIYCYIMNMPSIRKFVKRRLSKRMRQEGKQYIKQSLEEMEEKEMGERINYVGDKESGYTCTFVNYPTITFEASSFEEMERLGKISLEVHIEHTQDTLKKKTPFEFKEVSMEEMLKN